MKPQVKAHAKTGAAFSPGLLLFTLPSHAYMVEELQSIPTLTMGAFTLARFPNHELHITLDTDIIDRECVVLGSIAPPETNLVTFLLLCHTLKTAGARTIKALLPYLAYSRHDRKEPQKSHATALIGALLSSAGVDEVITVDVHSLQAHQLFPMPLVSLTPAKRFAEEMIKRGLQNTTIVAPDEGAIDRCKAVANAAGIDREIAYLTKTRTEQGITHRTLHGAIGKQVVIVDDMLDTGGTLISCCDKLRESGVDAIEIMVTHGLFTGNKWEQLWNLGVKRIYCTDTLALPKPASIQEITVLSIIPLLIEKLKDEQ